MNLESILIAFEQMGPCKLGFYHFEKRFATFLSQYE